MKVYLLGICFFLLGGCVQPHLTKRNSLDCDYNFKDIVPYSLEALEYSYLCKKSKEVIK
jgi:hypothetical protein